MIPTDRAIPADTVRLTDPADPAADADKEWLHLNLFDHENDVAGLVNVSLHGRPGSAAAQVVTAALFDRAGQEWVGDVVVAAQDEAQVTMTSIAAPSGVMALVGGQVRAAVTTHAVRLRVAADPVLAAFEIEPAQPFGSGWIGWRVVPTMTVVGQVELGHPCLGERSGAAGPLVGYHDHNWGQWHWGDDIGWEWGSFVAAPESGTEAGTAAVVAARTTDRLHRDAPPFSVVLDCHGVRRRFDGGRVTARWSGTAPPLTCRRPGALAALHSDRRRPQLPAVLSLTARSGADRLELEFVCRAAAQLVLADPVVVGSSFLHELSGRFRAAGRLAGRPFAFAGLGMVELLA